MSTTPAQSSLEVAERLATIFMAFLGLIAFGWQVREHFGSRAEAITVEAREPEITAGGTVQLPIDLINRSDRPIYVRNIFLRSTSIRSLLPDSGLSFVPGSVIMIEPGNVARFTGTPSRVLTGVRIGGASDLYIRVSTTRKLHQMPIHFSFSPAILNTITIAAGGNPIVQALGEDVLLALKHRTVSECRKLVGPTGDTIAVFRDADQIYFGGRAEPGMMNATDYICARVARPE